MGTQEDLAMYAQVQLGPLLQGINLFAGREPDGTPENDPCVTFRNAGDEGGGTYTYGQRKRALSHARVMIWARSKIYGTANDLAAALYDVMQQYNVVANGTNYQMIRPMSEPQPWGPDANDRQQIGFLVRTLHA